MNRMKMVTVLMFAFAAMVTYSFAAENSVQATSKTSEKVVQNKKTTANVVSSKKDTTVKATPKAQSLEIVGNWKDEETSEPYTLAVNKDGSYTLIADQASNNIQGKWTKIKKNSYKFTDSSNFMGESVKMAKEKGKVVLTVTYKEKAKAAIHFTKQA
ncbi:MAG: hypothetical protein AUK31_02800 [Fibrobacteres bacterium CG2_30_45_31]|nr:MAG: hypothetical protein AUK31_02800 [Fibrobacteres bacterium CG2_30_45_31]